MGQVAAETTYTTGKKSNSLSASESRWGYGLIAPMMIGFSIFFLIALGASFVLSFTKWDLLNAPVFNGLDNYRKVFGDPKFRTALFNTFAIAIPNVILRVGIAMGLAVALNSKIAFRTFYRIVFFLPVLTMPVATATIWKWVFDPKYGPVNGFLRQAGFEGPSWLFHQNTAIFAVVIVLLWSGVGYDMIIFLAGLQAIPRDYYEASSLDGASGWQQFRDITVPLLTPTTFFLSVIAVIGSLQVFDLVYVMTRLDTSNRLPTLVYYIYNLGFEQGQMGYAIAVAWVLLALILGFTFVQFRMQRRWVHYQ